MAPPAAARAGWSGWPGRCASPAVAREPRAGWRDCPRWPPARHRCVPRARPGPPRRAPQAARDGSPQARPGPPRRSPPRAVRSLAPRPGPSTSPPGRMMSPRRTTLPELARLPPKVSHLRPSPRFGRTRAAGPEPLGLLPDPLPPAQLRSAPPPRPARPAEAPRRRRPEWQSGLPGQPLPRLLANDSLALPRAPLLCRGFPLVSGRGHLRFSLPRSLLTGLVTPVYQGKCRFRPLVPGSRGSRLSLLVRGLPGLWRLVRRRGQVVRGGLDLRGEAEVTEAGVTRRGAGARTAAAVNRRPAGCSASARRFRWLEGRAFFSRRSASQPDSGPWS